MKERKNKRLRKFSVGFFVLGFLIFLVIITTSIYGSLIIEPFFGVEHQMSGEEHFVNKLLAMEGIGRSPSANDSREEEENDTRDIDDDDYFNDDVTNGDRLTPTDALYSNTTLPDDLGHIPSEEGGEDDNNVVPDDDDHDNENNNFGEGNGKDIVDIIVHDDDDGDSEVDIMKEEEEEEDDDDDDLFVDDKHDDKNNDNKVDDDINTDDNDDYGDSKANLAEEEEVNDGDNDDDNNIDNDDIIADDDDIGDDKVIFIEEDDDDQDDDDQDDDDRDDDDRDDDHKDDEDKDDDDIFTDDKGDDENDRDDDDLFMDDNDNNESSKVNDDNDDNDDKNNKYGKSLSPKNEFYSNTTLPDILFAGIAKAGTTALTAWLYSRKYIRKEQAEGMGTGGICSPRTFDDEPQFYRKEVHFFNKNDRYEKGLDFYLEHFENCAEAKQMSMDGCPDYMRVPERVYDTYAKAGEERHVKIIFSLREPISQQFSWHNHLQKRGDDIPSFTEWIEPQIVEVNNPIGVNTGKYAKFLKTWFELFDRKNILVLNYEEVLNHPGRVMWRIQEFLGVEIPGQLQSWNTLTGTKKKVGPPCKLRDELVKAYEPHNEDLYELLAKYPGPPSEERPFSRFSKMECV